ncbi:MAG: DUF7380 domain-containing protein [Caulobacteraceae bacterium]
MDQESERQVVPATAFLAADIEGHLSAQAVVDAGAFQSIFNRAAEEAREEGSDAASVFSLLAGICSFHFKPDEQGEPFGPMIVMDGRRSPIPSDFAGDQNAEIAKVAKSITNHALRARLADTVWINDRKQKDCADLAVDSYCTCIEYLINGDAKSRFMREDEFAYEFPLLLRRAFQISSATSKGGKPASRVLDLAKQLTNMAAEGGNTSFFLRISRVAFYYSAVEDEWLAQTAERMASKEGIDPHFARSLYQLATKAYGEAKDTEGKLRCQLAAAEELVKSADKMKGSAIAESHWLMDAIHDLRRIPGTKGRRAELEIRLREAQRESLSELQPFSHEMDISAIVKHTIELVEGLSLPQALAQFADLDRSPNISDLRDQAIKLTEQFPLSSMFASTHMDDEGKVVSKSTGSDASAVDFENIKHKISQHESLRRSVVVSGNIEPARRFIQTSHPLSDRHFWAICRASPFISQGYAGIFALGFARFMQGDFVSAAHLLIPQLEQSLRHLLKMVGDDPSAINSDLTQEDKSLSTLIDEYGPQLSTVLGENILNEIDLIFNFRGGPALRHALAHGKLPPDMCAGSDVIYACWFIYRLCCLPLFEHWEEISDGIEP